jgi:two-component system cell cycle response regulator DivK
MNAKLLRDVLIAGGTTSWRRSRPRPARAARGRARLILMDIQLPGMDGIAAVAELKRDPHTAKIPVVAVTASAMPSSANRSCAGSTAIKPSRSR